MDVVGKTVKKHRGPAVGASGFGIGDIKDAGFNRLDHSGHLKVCAAACRVALTKSSRTSHIEAKMFASNERRPGR